MASSQAPATSSLPTKVTIVIPDIASPCDFELRFNRHGKRVANASKRWMLRSGKLHDRTRRGLQGLKCGLLTSTCYPHAASAQLQVACDFLNWLFHLDNLSDDMEGHDTRSMADTVMNVFYHPFTYPTRSNLGKLTGE
jgi:hypothetical protein